MTNREPSSFLCHLQRNIATLNYESLCAVCLSHFTVMYTLQAALFLITPTGSSKGCPKVHYINKCKHVRSILDCDCQVICYAYQHHQKFSLRVVRSNCNNFALVCCFAFFRIPTTCNRIHLSSSSCVLIGIH